RRHHLLDGQGRRRRRRLDRLGPRLLRGLLRRRPPRPPDPPVRRGRVVRQLLLPMSLVAIATLVGLGAFHGLNPGMGWLFAVALGLQERDRGAVLRAVPAIAAGHAAAVALALAVLAWLQQVLDARAVALATAAVLVAFGGWRLLRRRH